MSGYPGSLSIDQEHALEELKSRLQAWIDKPKEENKNFTRDQEEEEASAAAADLAAMAAEHDDNDDGSGELMRFVGRLALREAVTPRLSQVSVCLMLSVVLCSSNRRRCCGIARVS